MRKSLIIYGLAGIIWFPSCIQNNSINPTRENLVEAVFASGNVISEDHYIVTSQTEGYLSKSYLDEGDSVKTGQIIFRIENEAQEKQLENAQANYQSARLKSNDNSPLMKQLIAQQLQIRNKLETDSINYIRHKKLVQSEAVSQIDYEKAKLAFENSKQDLVSIENQIADTKTNLQLEVLSSEANLASQESTSSYYQIKSKVDGIILQIHKSEGELIKRGEHVSEIGSGEYIAKLYLVEEDVNKIKVGQEVFIELNTEKNRSYKAYLSKVYPFFDSQEQSFIAEARFTEPVYDLKSGTQLQANIKINETPNVLVIPAEYLLPGDYVMAKNRQKIKVTTGAKTTNWVEILSGIDDTSTIILPRKRG
jgi:multidrug resistance efflux pump